MSQPLLPAAIRKEGDDRLLIDWTDGHHSVYTWKHLREHCPCAACREERQKPPDPFRLVQPADLVPLRGVAMPKVGRYGYRIVWSDGHETGIYTLEHLRALCQCPDCTARK
jgi:DUF971 family protein